MTISPKVLFIGIDAGDKDLIQKWAAEGVLPNLARLMHNSTNSTIRNPTGLYVGAVWPSFYTGLSPANHSRYCYRQMLPGTYDIVDINSTRVKGTPVWSYLSKAGRKVAVIDVPKSPPPQTLNGIHIADWGTHDPEFPFETFPRDLKDTIHNRFGVNPMRNCNAFRTHESEFVSFQTLLTERIHRRAAITKYILGHQEWDCVFTVFSESHCVGHQCWHLHDATHVRHDHRITSSIGDPIKSIYGEIDAAIGSILEHVNFSDTRVMVLASHGMQAHYDGTFLLEDILKAQEKKGHIPHYDTTLKKIRFEKIRRLSPRVAWRLKRFIISRHYSKFKSFPVPNNDVYGAVRINVRGREPAGRVKPGRDYERYCDQLINGLMEFVNVTTKESIVKRVLKTKDVFPNGTNIDALPDLLIEWNRSSPISEVYSPTAGTVKGEYKKCRTGDHSESGMVWITGNGIPNRHVENHVCIEDLAPTIAHWLEVALPATDGNALSL